MNTRTDFLISLIHSLTQFKRQVDGMTVSNRAQVAKARAFMDECEPEPHDATVVRALRRPPRDR